MKKLEIGSLEEAEIMHPIYESHGKEINEKLQSIQNIDFMEIREQFKKEAHDKIIKQLESMGYISDANHHDVLAQYTR